MLKLSHTGKAFRNYSIEVRRASRVDFPQRRAAYGILYLNATEKFATASSAAQGAGLMTAPCWRAQDGGKLITVEPGLIGGEVNRLLLAYKKKHKLADAYKIGPDPSSIDSCMMGGIVANNSSGMCCGVKQARSAQTTLSHSAVGSCCKALGWLPLRPPTWLPTLRRHGTCV